LILTSRFFLGRPGVSLYKNCWLWIFWFAIVASGG
jgi:hypothetical protein